MTTTTKLLLASALAAATTGGALAADLPPPAPLPEPLPQIESRSFGSWYLRGDIGIGITSDGDWSQDDVTAADGRFLYEALGDSLIVGGGVGYKFNNWLRADLTAEYRGTIDVDGIDEYQFICTFAGGTCANVGDQVTRNNIWNGSISSTVIMANAYVDLGSYHGLTPFVGAGIGASYNSFSAGVEFDPSDLGGGGHVASNSDWDLAWALMAGFGFQVNDRLALELGYRYIDLGDVETGSVTCLGHTACELEPLHIEDITSHDIRLGMRWHFGAKDEVFIQEDPLIVKY
ncbi:MAG: outer membrane beta-barrel protein [Pseudomonadota bacterium]